MGRNCSTREKTRKREGAMPAATRLMQQLMWQFDEKHAFWLVSILAKARTDGLTVADLIKHVEEVRPDAVRQWKDYIEST